ncbi:MAG: PfkB family carbohydrate kinase [Terracidiphilus sp.]
MKQPHLILGIGELLWDLLPGGLPLLGGAPANFAVMAGQLGNHAVILSRIGRDELGRKAVERLDPLPADTSFLQVDASHETGRVTVGFEGEQPSYTIHQPAAWDFLELTDRWVQLAERADAICFGSLAQRTRESRQTIQALAAQSSASCVRVFDVNLRAPFYSGKVIRESLELATVIKMNDAEAATVLALLGMPELPDLPAQAEAAPVPPRFTVERRGLIRLGADWLLAKFPSLEMVAVTCGAHGSLLVTRDEWHAHPGFPVKVADTIGAGDAFTAAMTHYLLRGADLATLNEAGNRWGAWVASQAGAMPPLPDAVRLGVAAAIES